MGRIGYLGCLVLMGVVMLSVSCLAVFGAAGAITAERGSRVAPVAAPKAKAEPTRVPDTGGEIAKPAEEYVEAPAPAATKPANKPEATAPAKAETAPPAAKPAAVGTIPPQPTRAGPESNIAQRLDREAVGGGLKLRALGAAKTSQGDRSVLAIYVRMENDGAQPIRVDPQLFKMVDRAGGRYAITRAVEQMFPPVELGPKGGPGEPGKLTEGNLTFEIPKTAAGLALIYEIGGAQPLRIPLPPEFG